VLSEDLRIWNEQEIQIIQTKTIPRTSNIENFFS